jgi:hypothetical protein
MTPKDPKADTQRVDMLPECEVRFKYGEGRFAEIKGELTDIRTTTAATHALLVEEIVPKITTNTTNIDANQSTLKKQWGVVILILMAIIGTAIVVIRNAITMSADNRVARRASVVNTRPK